MQISKLVSVSQYRSVCAVFSNKAHKCKEFIFSVYVIICISSVHKNWIYYPFYWSLWSFVEVHFYIQHDWFEDYLYAVKKNQHWKSRSICFSDIGKSFTYFVACLMTGPLSLPQQVLYIVWCSVSSFNFQCSFISLKLSNSYICLLPCLLVTSVFLSITCL